MNKYTRSEKEGNHTNELYVIKRVSLDKTDADIMNGYINEIALLKRLEGNSLIVRLIDSEVKAGPGGSKGHLLLVMESGEMDLARLLQEQMKEPVNLVWVAYYWHPPTSTPSSPAPTFFMPSTVTTTTKGRNRPKQRLWGPGKFFSYFFIFLFTN